MTRRQGWQAMVNKTTTKKATTPKKMEDLELKDAAKVTGGVTLTARKAGENPIDY